MKFLGIAALALLTVSCNGGKSESTSASDSTNVVTTSQDSLPNTFAGLYKGTLPAADCEGINTTLQINATQPMIYEVNTSGKRTEFLNRVVYTR